VTDREPDLELLTRLHAADPASSLPPADPERVTRLLEEVMSDTSTGVHESRETGTHGRSPLTWLVAAAAVVLIAGGIFGLAARDHGSTPAAGPSVTELHSTSIRGLCVRPNAQVLRLQSIAFRGTLVSLTERTATFAASHWYAGGPTDLVKVKLMPRGIAETVQAADLTVGHDYLVAASDGNVTGCGFTGQATRSLQRLYDRAFG